MLRRIWIYIHRIRALEVNKLLLLLKSAVESNSLATTKQIGLHKINGISVKSISFKLCNKQTMGDGVEGLEVDGYGNNNLSVIKACTPVIRDFN